jgi:hypothetical protein
MIANAGGATRSCSGDPRDRPPPQNNVRMRISVIVYIHNQSRMRTATRPMSPTSPSPSWYPNIDKSAICGVLGVIATAHRPEKAAPWQRRRMGEVRSGRIQRDEIGVEKRRCCTRDIIKIWLGGKSANQKPCVAMAFLCFPARKGRGRLS